MFSFSSENTFCSNNIWCKDIKHWPLFATLYSCISVTQIHFQTLSCFLFWIQPSFLLCILFCFPHSSRPTTPIWLACGHDYTIRLPLPICDKLPAARLSGTVNASENLPCQCNFTALAVLCSTYFTAFSIHFMGVVVCSGKSKLSLSSTSI